MSKHPSWEQNNTRSRVGMVGNLKIQTNLNSLALAHNHYRPWRHWHWHLATLHLGILAAGTSGQPRRVWLGSHTLEYFELWTSCSQDFILTTDELDTIRSVRQQWRTEKKALFIWQDHFQSLPTYWYTLPAFFLLANLPLLPLKLTLEVQNDPSTPNSLWGVQRWV